MVFNQITATNLNANEQADYTISFTPQTDIPYGGLIEVTFPIKNYQSMPISPYCHVSGGLTSFQSCYLTGQTYYIQTNSRYAVGDGVITFLLRNVGNPNQGQSDGFLV